MSPVFTVQIREPQHTLSSCTCLTRLVSHLHMSNVMTGDQLSPAVTVMTADCHLELNCPTVKKFTIIFVKVRQLNEIGEIPIRYLFM